MRPEGSEASETLRNVPGLSCVLLLALLAITIWIVVLVVAVGSSAALALFLLRLLVLRCGLALLRLAGSPLCAGFIFFLVLLIVYVLSSLLGCLLFIGTCRRSKRYFFSKTISFQQMVSLTADKNEVVETPSQMTHSGNVSPISLTLECWDSTFI